MSNRNLSTAGVFSLLIFVGWYGGMDYFSRGFFNACMLLVFIYLSGMIYFLPVWEDK